MVPLLLPLCACAGQRFAYSSKLMGTHAKVVLYANDAADARRAADAAFARIEELEQVMSDYRDDSELMRLCATAGGPPQRVSRDLFTVLAYAEEVSRASDGAFDVTVGPYVRIWRGFVKEGLLPDLAAARPLVGWRLVELDADEQTVQLERSGMRLDLGGIGKGYAADEAVAVLVEHGFERCLVDLGGDIVVGAPPPGAVGWKVLVDGRPRRMAHRAVAASGDTERFIEINGKRYSHILDPTTGLGVTHRLQVWVTAPTGMQADAMASALSVLGPERGRRVVRKLPEVEVIYRTERASRKPTNGPSTSHH